MKNKQVTNKPVAHQSTKVAEELAAANRVLHSTFYATYTPDLYLPKGFINSKPVAGDPKAVSNGFQAKEWNCTPRHASKIRSNRGEPKCTTNCACPKAMKALAAAPVPA